MKTKAYIGNKMYNLGAVKEYSAEKGYGFVSNQDSHQNIFFHISDFPKEGGEPKIGENLKYLIVEEEGKFKANQITRLDVAISNKLAQRKIAQTEPKKIEYKKEKIKKSKIVIPILLILGLFALFGSWIAWGKYQVYKTEQAQKLELYKQQQQKIVDQQRKDVGTLKPIYFTEKSERALNNESSKKQPEVIVIKEERKGASNTISANQTAKSVQAKFSCDGRTHCSQMRSYEEAVFFIRNCPNTKMDGNNDGRPCERQFGK